MKRSGSLALVLITAFLLVVCTGCSKHEQSLSNIFSKGITYKNDDFGITIPIPDNWYMHNQDTLEELHKKAIALLNENKKIIDDSSTYISLVMISKYPPESSPKHDAAVFLSEVELVRGFPNIKDGKDYLIRIKKQLEKGKVNYRFEKDIYTEKIDGIEFGVLEYKNKIQDIEITQKFYTAIINNCAYNFILGYVTQEDLKTLNEIISSIKIER